MVTTLAQNIGKGVVAGLAGTVAMTVSSTMEQKLRRRPPSLAPAEAAEKVLGIGTFASEAAEKRFSTLVHWGYGTGLGVLRGVLRTMGLSPRAATAAHYAAMYGGNQVTLPALDVAPPFLKWGAEEIAIDAWHHLVYVLATGLAYELLDGER
jgi:hypothetical protein